VIESKQQGLGLSDLHFRRGGFEYSAVGCGCKQAQANVYMFDINGLLEDTRTDLVDFQKSYAHRHAPTRDFVAAIEIIKPTTIIGVSTVGGTFSRRLLSQCHASTNAR